MIAGIMTTPRRGQYLPALLKVLTPSVETVIICSHLPSVGDFLTQALRTYDAALSRAASGEPVLLCTDDVIAPPDWRERWEAIHAEARATRYALFTRHLRLATPENLARGWVLTNHANSWYDQAQILIDHQDWVPRLRAWIEGGGQVPKGKVFHHDVIAQAYINERHLSYVVTMPSLFEHIGTISNPSLRHSVGKAAVYVGDIEPASSIGSAAS